MEKKVISKAIILQEGINFNNLAFESCGDRILDNYEDEGGKPFTGLTYELYDNGNIEHYSYYVNGFSDGDYVRFYKDGTIRSISKMKKGRCTKETEWFANGKMKEEGIYSYGICVTKRKWNEHGLLIFEKKSPTADEEKSIKISSKWYD